jgi:hypothetical protein
MFDAVFYEKKANYFKFFEDIKLIEVDHEFKRLAIVFFGKENYIHIFDSKPYMDYLPIKEKPPSPLPKQINQNHLEKEFEIRHNYIPVEDVYNIFNYQENRIQNQSNQREANIMKCPFGSQIQEFVLFNNLVLNDKLAENDVKKPNDFQIENFNFTIQSTINRRKILHSLKKPKLTSKLLSIFNISNPICGIKWFSILSNNIVNQVPANGQHSYAKFLIIICEDGKVRILTLMSCNYSNKTIVNKRLLHSDPFMSYPEEWKVLSQIDTGNPIKDFCITESCPKKFYTLHFDNFILSWMIVSYGNKLSIISHYAINLSPNLPINKILVDQEDKFLYVIHSNAFKIYRILDQPPFPCLFQKTFFPFNDIRLTVEKNEKIEKLQNNNTQKNKSSQSQSSQSNFFFSASQSQELEEYKMLENISQSESRSSFIDQDLSDLLDSNSQMQLHDYNFFANYQKPEFSPLEEYIIIPISDAENKRKQLYRFKNLEWSKKILSDYDFFNKCYFGNHKDSADLFCEKIYDASEDSLVTFMISPSLYLSNHFSPSDEIEIDSIKYNSIIAIFTLNKIEFLNLNTQETILKYDILDHKFLSNDYMICKWLHKHTLLFTSQKRLFHMIKFIERKFGIPVCPKKIKEFCLN